MIHDHVLFIVNEVAHYREFKKIIDSEVFRLNNLKYVVLFDRDGFDISKLFEIEILDCKKNNINYRFLPETAINRSSSFFSRVSNQVLFYKEKLLKLRLFFKNENISSIILGEENILMDTFLYKKAFGHRPVLVYPYTIPNPKEMAGGAAKSVSKCSIRAALLILLGGRFVKTIEQKTYLLVNPYKIVAMFWVGYIPKNPWVLNSDSADKICIESQKMAELYIQLGVEKKKLKLIGSFNDDIMAEALKTKIQKKDLFLKKYNLPADKPIILIAFPPSQFPLKSAEHSNYQDLIQTMGRCLQPYLTAYTVIVAKHPRMTHSLTDLQNIGFVVAEEPTVDLIPLAYIYIASASATIRWALATAIPVINYDMYRYHYSDYDKAVGVLTVYSEIDFKKELHHTLTELSHYTNWVKNLSQEANQWGILDGGAGQRFIHLLTNPLNKGDKNASP